MSALVSMKFQGSDARNPLGVRGKNHGGWERLSAHVSMKVPGERRQEPFWRPWQKSRRVGEVERAC